MTLDMGGLKVLSFSVLGGSTAIPEAVGNFSRVLADDGTLLAPTYVLLLPL